MPQLPLSQAALRPVYLPCRPFEEAFDNGFMVIEYQSNGEYRLHWLGDPKLRISDCLHYPWPSASAKLGKLGEKLQQMR